MKEELIKCLQERHDTVTSMAHKLEAKKQELQEIIDRAKAPSTAKGSDLTLTEWPC